jgi:hypothetical protein
MPSFLTTMQNSLPGVANLFRVGFQFTHGVPLDGFSLAASSVPGLCLGAMSETLSETLSNRNWACTSESVEHGNHSAQKFSSRSGFHAGAKCFLLVEIQASSAFQSRTEGIIQRPGFIRPGQKPGPFGNIQYDALGCPAKMLNDGVPPTPGSRKLFGASAESQRLLINFEPVMGEHSVATLTNNSTKFPTKFPTKEGQRGPRNVQTPEPDKSRVPGSFLVWALNTYGQPCPRGFL